MLLGMLGLNELESTYHALREIDDGRSMEERLLGQLQVSYRVPDRDRARIPGKGRR